MIGAVVGDIAGSRFEFCNLKLKEFVLLAAAAVFQLQSSAAGFNNAAVMMWEHQCDRLRMDPETVKFFLEKAKRGGAPNAAENLEVLRPHIPEVFMTGSGSIDDRE